MQRGSWVVLLWLPNIAALTVAVGWGAKNACVFQHSWIPFLAWLVGIVLLAIGRPRVCGSGEGPIRRAEFAWAVFAYAVLLGLAQPMLVVQPMLVAQPYRDFGPCFVLLLAPLAWVGVTGPGRDEWVRGVGAWSVLYGQFFALIYNITHADSGIGCWSGWAY